MSARERGSREKVGGAHIVEGEFDQRVSVASNASSVAAQRQSHNRPVHIAKRT